MPDEKEVKVDSRLTQAALEECAECPKCMDVSERENRVNLMQCDGCQIYYCFNCGVSLGSQADGEEKAKIHYEVAYCRYIDAASKSKKTKFDEVK